MSPSGKAQDFVKTNSMKKIMQENIKKGLLTELRCEIDFTNLGFVVSKPITTDSRYDYIVDINGKLLRIQCKTGNAYDEEETAFSFQCCSSNWNTKSLHSYSKEEIDYYYIVFKDKSYLFPVELGNKKTKILRLSTKNKGNQCTITWAKDYEFTKIMEELVE